MVRQITLEELEELAKQARENLQKVAGNIGRPVKLYIHWSAGHYQQYFEDYHINIGQYGEVLISTDHFDEYKLHTYHRNSGAIAIVAACAYNAWSTDDLGPEPPTDQQIEAIAQVVAVLAKALELSIDSTHVMTHAEAADNLDGDTRWHESYGPNSTTERWDFWVLKAGDEPGSGGNILRGKSLWYYYNGV